MVEARLVHVDDALTSPPAPRFCHSCTSSRTESVAGRRWRNGRPTSKTAGTSDEGMLKKLRRGWCFGSEEFRQRMIEMVAGAARRPLGGILAAHNEHEAERLMAAGLDSVGLRVEDSARARKGDPRKIAVAAVVKRRTIMGNERIARRLHMSAAGRVSRHCSEAGSRADMESWIQAILAKAKG